MIDVRGLGGPSSVDPRVDASGDKPSPALRPGRASASTTSSGRVPSLHAFRRRCAQPCSGASPVVWTRPTPPAFLTGYAHSSFPARPGAWTTAGDKRSPRFRRVPFRRDMVSDPGRATAPRIPVPPVLPSTVLNGSASAMSSFSGLNTYPIRSLCTLRERRHRRPRNTRYRAARYDPTRAGLPPAGPRQLRLAHQHSLPGGRYPLPGPDFHRLERASFAWRTASPSPTRI